MSDINTDWSNQHVLFIFFHYHVMREAEHSKTDSFVMLKYGINSVNCFSTENDLHITLNSW